MSKYIVKTDDSTVNGYLECYDHMNIDEIKIMTKVFDKLVDHELYSGNYLTDQDKFIRSGIRIEEKKKKYHAFNKVEMSQQDLIRMYDGNEKDVYFYRSVASLLNATPYLSSDDRFELDFLFQGFIELNRGIDEFVEYNGDLYLPVCNNKVKRKGR